MRKLFAVLALLALAVTPVFAQSNPVLNDSNTVVDTAPAALIWYVGSDTTAAVTVEVETDGNLTLLQGGAADTTVECPVSGDAGGIIDVSNAACDTFGELVTLFASTAGSEWRIGLITALASDSSNDSLVVQAATEARGDGDVLMWDDSVKLTTNAAFIPGVLDADQVVSAFFAPNAQRNVFRLNPFANARQNLKYAFTRFTSAGTIVDTVVSCVVPKINSAGTYSETVTEIYRETGPASTVIGLIDEFNYAGGAIRCDNGKIHVRTTTDTALTAPFTMIYGFSSKPAGQ